MSHAANCSIWRKLRARMWVLVTCVAPVHLEFFASLEEIALAKRELIEGLAGSESVAVLNADDPRVARFAEVAPGRVVTYGVVEDADFRAENIQDRGLNGSEFDFLGPQVRARLSVSLAGRHNISNALAALAAASVWGVGAAEAREVFPKLQATGMRGRVLQYDAGFTVINDCYNSNPVALRAMIDLLASTPAAGRHILAAGEMLELGAASAHNWYREAGGGGCAGEARLDDWRTGRCGKFCARGCRRRVSGGTGKVLRVARRGRRVCCTTNRYTGRYPLSGRTFAPV